MEDDEIDNSANPFFKEIVDLAVRHITPNQPGAGEPCWHIWRPAAAILSRNLRQTPAFIQHP